MQGSTSRARARRTSRAARRTHKQRSDAIIEIVAAGMERVVGERTGVDAELVDSCDEGLALSARSRLLRPISAEVDWGNSEGRWWLLLAERDGPYATDSHTATRNPAPSIS